MVASSAAGALRCRGAAAPAAAPSALSHVAAAPARVTPLSRGRAIARSPKTTRVAARAASSPEPRRGASPSPSPVSASASASASASSAGALASVAASNSSPKPCSPAPAPAQQRFASRRRATHLRPSALSRGRGGASGGVYGSADAWTPSSSSAASASSSSRSSSTSSSSSYAPSSSTSSTSSSSSAPAPSSSSSLPFTLAQLASFRALTTAGSLEAAADATGRPPAKLAATVGRLERDLGFALLAAPPGSHFNNDADEGGNGGNSSGSNGGGNSGNAAQLLASGHPLRLTPAGALLDRYAERLLSLGADALAATRDARELRTGEVYLAASQTTGVYVLPKLIGEFKAAHPGVALQLAVENTRRCCAAVARGEADIALVGGEVPADLARLLRVEEYAEDEVVLILPPGHEAAKRAAKEQEEQEEEERAKASSSEKSSSERGPVVATCGSIDVSELPSLRYVSLHKSSTVQAIHTRLEAAGLDWRSLPVVLEVNSVEAIKGAVEAGLGAAFVSAAAVAKEARIGSLCALRVRGAELTRKLLCVTDPERYLPRAARQFAVEQCGLAVDERGFVRGRRSSRKGGEDSKVAGGGDGDDDEQQGHSSSSSSSSSPGGINVPAAGCSRYPHLAGRSPPLSELGGPGSAPRGRAGCPPPSGPARSVPGMVHENSEHPSSSSSAAANVDNISFAQPSSSGSLSASAPSSSSSRSSSSSSLCELPFTLAQLAALQAVARTGSGVAAALTLGVSQPAVSKAIAALESGLACGALLRPGRRGGPTSLTEAGAALLPHCERTLAAAREAARALADLGAGGDAGSVRLGASQTVGTYVMPRILAAFRRANPRVTAQLVVDSSSAVCAAVASGDLDAAIVGGDVPEALISGGSGLGSSSSFSSSSADESLLASLSSSSSASASSSSSSSSSSPIAAALRVTPYAADELVLVVPPGHPLAAGGGEGNGNGSAKQRATTTAEAVAAKNNNKTASSPSPSPALLSLDEDGWPVAPLRVLYDLVFVSLNRGSSVAAAQEATLRRAGIETHKLRVDMEFTSVEAIKGAVQAGLGAAFVSRAAIEKEVALGLLAPLRLEGVTLARTLWLVAPRGGPPAHSPAAAKFLDDLFCGGDGSGVAGAAGSASDAAAAAVVASKLQRAQEEGGDGNNGNGDQSSFYLSSSFSPPPLLLRSIMSPVRRPWESEG